MGWNERGKKGIHCGRTLRRNVSHRRDPGVIRKYQENTATVPNSVTRSVLQERYGLTDGLHMNFIPHRKGNDGVLYSLGKRKRWLLRDLVKERAVQTLEDEDVVDSVTTSDLMEDDEEEIQLCFHERDIFYGHGVTRGDCVSVYSDLHGERYPNHAYSFYSDIRIDNESPEVGYEICNPPSSNSWPNFKEHQLYYNDRYWDLNGRKSKSKCKGRRNKGDRFGFDRDDFELGKLKGTKRKRSSIVDCKVKTISQKDFQKTIRNMDNERRKHGIGFDLDEFTVPAVHHTRDIINSEKKIDNSPKLKTCEKGCAIFVESESINPQPQIIPQELEPTSFIKSQHKVNINLDAQQVETENLLKEWGSTYKEGTMSPRKFAINITSHLPTNELKKNSITHVVFEMQGQVSKDNIDAVVSLVHITLEGKSTLDNAALDFVMYIKRIQNSCETWEIQDVVKAAVQCIRVMKDLPEDVSDKYQTWHMAGTKSQFTLEMLNSLCGWQSESFSLGDAKQHIKEKLESTAKTSKIVGDLGSDWELVPSECGICYGTFEGNSGISLTDCGHSFCNECWAGHISTQVTQSVGHVKCPGYDCDKVVDSIIMMSLNPLMYEQHIKTAISKYFETSSEWKWCPGKQCQRLVKVSDGKQKDSMTVLCKCNATWCFKCQGKAHWPATCKEAEKFQEKMKDAEDALATDSKEFINSVMVKNCPQCNYPIEKYFGCQFMMCVLCQVHFCWNCVTIATYGHTCDKQPSDSLDEVFLNFKSKQYQIQKYVQIVLYNAKVCKESLMCFTHRQLEKSETSQSTILDFPGHNSRVSRLVASITNKETLKLAREAAQFEFQSRLVVDGLAQKAAMSKTRVRLCAARKMSQLAFISERIRSVLSDPSFLSQSKKQDFLKRLLEIGIECVSSVKNM